jgi:hypothetical protein
MLRKPKQSNQQASILQQNLFVVLTSTEMIALARLFSILHISICMPFRYLAGKTHEFKMYNWGAADVSRVINTLYGATQKLKKDPELLLDPLFMMNIFTCYQDQLPPFKEYWDLMFKSKAMKVINKQDGTKVVHYGRVRRYCFAPVRLSDKETNDKTIEFGVVAAERMEIELTDKKKATWKYLNLSKSEYCWDCMSDERKQTLLGVAATNDEAESVLGGTTANIQRYGRINLSNASAVSDAKRNSFFNRSKKSRPGLLHTIDEDIRQIIVSIAMKDAPETVIAHRAELDVQANARRMKEELIKQKNVEKISEEYIDALYYHAMYSSAACWKGDPKNVSVELSKLKTQTAKYNFTD